MADRLLPLEIAARAVCRVAAAGYPDTPAGRRRADEHVERHWRGVWTQMWGGAAGGGITLLVGAAAGVPS